MTTTTQRRQVRRLIQSIFDEYGVMCTIQHETPLCDSIADAVIAKLKPKKRQRTPAQVKSAELYHIAQAIAQVCLMDYEANKGRLFSEAKQLSKANPPPSPAEIRRCYGQDGTWYHDDWRGKQGKEPTPGQIRSTWAKLVGEMALEGDGPKEFIV